LIPAQRKVKQMTHELHRINDPDVGEFFAMGETGEIYVSKRGSNIGDGSIGAPYLTLAKAFASVSADINIHRIHQGCRISLHRPWQRWTGWHPADPHRCRQEDEHHPCERV